MTRAIGPPQVRPVERTVAGSHGTRRHTCETTRQHAVRNGVHAGQAPTHETQHKYSMHHDVEWRRQSMRMRSNVLCLRNYSIRDMRAGWAGGARKQRNTHASKSPRRKHADSFSSRAGGWGSKVCVTLRLGQRPRPLVAHDDARRAEGPRFPVDVP